MNQVTPTPAVQPATESIYIRGRRWFQKSYGNTYFSAVAYVDGKEVASIAFEYGYESQYESSMFDRLTKLGFTPDRESNEPAWRYAQRKGLKYNADAKDVPRKRDL
jgi:hypothetical protein